ncbi:MAG: ATP-binding domain-containing protein [Ignavibacteriaceae bacterium]|nr:ATP-binding domain-containing protein [Ignavibacteriaceae bacterium]
MIIEPLSDNNLEVEKCKEGKILSVGSKVRIFSVEYIKGLEFESVFFIDIDEIYKRKPNLVDKYLYVGLTRAGSFLAVTYKDQFPESLKFIKDSFKEGNWVVVNQITIYEKIKNYLVKKLKTVRKNR